MSHLGALSLIIGGPASTCLCSWLVIMQFLSHFNSKNTSQLINGMFNALQKLPKYLNDIANSIVCVPSLFALQPAAPAATLFYFILFLYLKISELTTLMLLKSLFSGSSLNSSL